MPRADPLKNSFIFGEISPRYKGQPDSDIYRGGVDYLNNYLVSSQGALYKRQGTKYLATCTAGSTSNRLFGFLVPNITSGGTVPFWVDFSNLAFSVRSLDGSTWMTSSAVTTPYPTSVLYSLRLVQVGRFIVVFCPFFPPNVITTSTSANWTISSTLSALHPTGRYGGPYLPNNTKVYSLGPNEGSTITITPAGTSGSQGVLASAPLFEASWVGRQIRLFDSSNSWKRAVITAVPDILVGPEDTCTILIQDTLASTAAIAVWALGLWSAESGYPSFGCFFQNRLWTGGVGMFPDRIDGSLVETLSFFEPTTDGGTVADSSGVTVYLRTNTLNKAEWLAPTEQGVVVGTEQDDFYITDIDGNGIAPTNTQAYPFSKMTSADSDAIRVDKTIISISRSRANLKETRFIDRMGGVHTREVPFIDEYLTLPEWSSPSSINIYPPARGVSSLVHSTVPDSRLWVHKSDGELLSCFIVNNEQQLVLAPSRIALGGVGGVSGTENPKIISVATIPGGTGVSAVFDFTAMIVQRRINGATAYYIERLQNDIDPTFPLEVQQFLDCHKFQETFATVTAITNANSGVVTTAAAHGFSNGNRIRFRNIFGMTGLGTGQYQVANVTATTFRLKEVGGGSNINTTGFGTFIASTASYASQVIKTQNTVTGLSHLEGETVSVWADGAWKSDAVVSGGSITLDAYYGIVVVGYKYTAQCRLLRMDVGSATGTALGKTQRSNRVGLMVDRIVDLKVGRDFTTMYSVRSGSTDLFSGVLTTQTDIDYELGNKVCIQQVDPYPATILAIMPGLSTQDR